MTTIKNGRRYRLSKVVRLNEDGTSTTEWVRKTMFNTTMSTPIPWKGQTAELHFWNYPKRTRINQAATDAFRRDGFAIRGPALVLTGSDLFEAFRTEGSPQQVKDQLSGLGLSEEPVVMPGRSDDGRAWSNVYVRDRNDALAVRMRLT